MVGLFAAFFVFLLFLFRGAFSTYIFQDDFYLFSISKAVNFGQFIHLFSPLKSYGFFRPLGIEIFYFLAGLINNLFVTRLAVFGVFFVGLIFLYKTVLLLVKDRHLSFLTVFMFGISFTHVYQLYWLATFQEVAVFTFSVLSVYLFLKKKLLVSIIMFVAGLLSREEAMLLPFILLFLTSRKEWGKTLIFFALATAFFFLYRINFALVAVRPEYTPHLDLHLITNNVFWYGLWSMGLPSFLPDFLPSIFNWPTVGFWTTVVNVGALPYLVVLTGYLIVFAVTFLSMIDKKVVKIVVFCLAAFLIYVLPMSVIVHKWMVRLTIPLVFIVFFQAYIIYHAKKVLAVFLLAAYMLYNFLAVPVHEIASTYRLDSDISTRVAQIIIRSGPALNNSAVIYFSDGSKKSLSGWEGSQKIKLTLSDQRFLLYYLSTKKMKAVYGFEQPESPKGSFIIDSSEILSNAGR